MKFLFIVILFTNILFANVGKIVALKGEANITRENKTFQVTKNTLLKEKDILKTNINSKVQILFQDETIISIGQNSIFKINDYLFENKENVKAEFSMIKGVFRTITGRIGKIAPQNFKLKTKSASIGIRGTQIITEIASGKERIFCTEGQIEVTQNGTNQSIIINQGEFITLDEKSIDNKLEKNKTKTKDLKKVNENISINKNKAIDTITKQEIPNNINTPEIADSTIIPNADDVENNIQTDEELKKQQDEEEKLNDKKLNDKKLNDKKLKDEKLKDEEEELIILEQESSSVIEEGIQILTPSSFYVNNSSKATYTGNFNSNPFNNSRQYIQEKGNDKLQIPTSTTISMNIDFGKEDDQVTNGKISILDKKDLEFDGEFKDDNTLELEGRNDTQGEGTASFFGTKGNNLIGNLKLENEDFLLEGEFQANKGEYNNLEELTNLSYFTDNTSKASYFGNFNSYNFNQGTQYKQIASSKYKIPDDSTISMDIDFGLSSNQISNGKIDHKRTQDLNFNGSIDGNSFILKGSTSTSGSGKGDFYGDNATSMQGEVNMADATGIRTKGQFNTSKNTDSDQ